MAGFRERLFGKRRDLRNPDVFHHVALIAFFAWVGLGADGLSSSSYGPEEALKQLVTFVPDGHGGFHITNDHTYLAVFLAVAMALTVFIISYGYSRIIEHFPHGGGGYNVASKYLGTYAGAVSGSALLVDYVLTIAVSLSAGADAIFSFLPPEWAGGKLVFAMCILGVLTLLNLRGVKESILVLTPIFLVFLLTHAVLIVGSIGQHVGAAGRVVHEVHANASHDLGHLGIFAILVIFMRAYSLGGGTFTGIEAVSNGLAMMREPRVRTGKRTMVLMAVSLALTAGGILLAYKLMAVYPDPTHLKTMNAMLAENFAGSWHIGGLAIGKGFVIITLVSEGALLFVAAQAGFLDGPRVMANMALDSWVPHRFSQLSEQLTMKNGVYLMAASAAAVLLYTKGRVDALIVMYSINVFVTFSMSNAAMLRHWWQVRKTDPTWRKHSFVHGLGFLLCAGILTITVIEKFAEGGWMTLVITTVVIALCISIRRHYKHVVRKVGKLATELSHEQADLPEVKAVPTEFDPEEPTAVVLVGGYGGLGIHTLMKIPSVFPKQFKQVVFISVGVIDAGTFKGSAEMEALKVETQKNLDRYVEFAKTKLGWAADSDMYVGTEAVSELERLCREVYLRFPRSVFFAGKLIFRQESWWQRILHNETGHAVQRRLEFDGLPMVVLPVRVMK